MHGLQGGPCIPPHTVHLVDCILLQLVPRTCIPEAYVPCAYTHSQKRCVAERQEEQARQLSEDRELQAKVVEAARAKFRVDKKSRQKAKRQQRLSATKKEAAATEEEGAKNGIVRDMRALARACAYRCPSLV